MSLTLAERLGLKKERANASGLDMMTWQGKAEAAAQAMGLSFDQWLLNGHNIQEESPAKVPASSVFSEASGPTVAQEVAAAQEDAGVLEETLATTNLAEVSTTEVSNIEVEASVTEEAPTSPEEVVPVIVREPETVIEETHKKPEMAQEIRETSFIPEDLGTSALFKKIIAETNPEKEDYQVGRDLYAELVENQVAQQCILHSVSNLDLNSFGPRGQSLSFKNLSVLTFGKHKFLGVPFTQKEEDAIVLRLALYCHKTSKDRIAIKAVHEVRGEGNLIFYSLQFNDRIIQKMVDTTGFAVYMSANEPDISKLMVVVDKCLERNSILS